MECVTTRHPGHLKLLHICYQRANGQLETFASLDEIPLQTSCPPRPEDSNQDTPVTASSFWPATDQISDSLISGAAGPRVYRSPVEAARTPCYNCFANPEPESDCYAKPEVSASVVCAGSGPCVRDHPSEHNANLSTASVLLIAATRGTGAQAASQHLVV